MDAKEIERLTKAQETKGRSKAQRKAQRVAGWFDRRMERANRSPSRVQIKDDGDAATLVVRRLPFHTMIRGVIDPYFAWVLVFPLIGVVVLVGGLAAALESALRLSIEAAVPLAVLIFLLAMWGLLALRLRPARLQVTKEGYYALSAGLLRLKPKQVGKTGWVNVDLGVVSREHSKTQDRMGLWGWVLVTFVNLEDHRVSLGVPYRLNYADADKVEAFCREHGVAARRSSVGAIF